MAWVRLADDFADHPKVVAAGPVAGWLWVCGIGYSNRYLTDGVIPRSQVKRLADIDDPYAIAERLVTVGLWERVDGGYRVHDYLDYQPAADVVKTERTKTAERVAAHRLRQRDKAEPHADSNGVTGDVTNARTNAGGNAPCTGAPYPVPARTRTRTRNPDPTPSVTSPQPPPQAEGERAAGAAKNPGRRNGRREPPEVITPLTPADRELWAAALLDASQDMNAANAFMLGQLEPVGRSADGAMLLRAPPGQKLERFRGTLARSLVDAGDVAGANVAIVEG